MFRIPSTGVGFKGVLLSIVISVLTADASASVLTVPSVYSNIQDAINVAAEGDTVLVADGVYSGDGFRSIRFLRKNVVLISESGPESTTLDFGSDSVQNHVGIILGENQTRASVIDGFTFRGGASTTYSATALGCSGASPTVRNCVFTGNVGLVISLGNSTAVFENCSIVANLGTSSGAIQCFSSTPEFRNCLIAYNADGPAFSFLGDRIAPDISCSLIFSNDGGDWTDLIAGEESNSGNLHVDPKICDYVTGDLHLQEDSPCRPDASGCGLIGSLGIGCIDGVSPFAANLSITPLDLNNHVFTSSPELSWEFSDTGATTQQGYIIHVVADADDSGDIFWADTTIPSDMTSVPYGGPQLNSHATYIVRVKLYDEYGGGPWRETAFFTHLASSFTVPISQPNIQDGIRAAFDGDTVIVLDGTYTGEKNRNISFLGKPIVLRSEHGAAYTVIDAEGTYSTRVFTFKEEEDSTSVLDGFTITGGSLNPPHDWGGGAGVSCDKSSPLIRNCVFTDNNTGAGLGCTRSSAIVENCTFVDNTDNNGSAIYVIQASITLRRCNIVFNNGGAAVVVQDNDANYAVTVECSNIFGNSSGAWDFPFLPVTDSAADALTFDPEHCADDLDFDEIRETSLCLPANNSCGRLIGAIDSVCLSSDVESDDDATVPSSSTLQIHPNPFNSATTITFSLLRRSPWTVSVYNVLGQQVARMNGMSGPGPVVTHWTPATSATGVYFCVLSTSHFTKVAKVLYLK